MLSKKIKYTTRNLELRSLRSWFKHLPLIWKSLNYDNNSEYYFSLHQENQFNIDNIISNDIDQRLTSRTKLILKQYLECWKIYAIYKLRRRKTLCEINYIYRVKLKRKIFNILSKNIIKSNKYYNETMQKRYFRLWIRYTEIIRINKIMIKRSMIFYIKKYLQKCINIWKVFVLRKKEKNMLKNQLIDKVCKLYNSSLLHKYFIKWITIHNYDKIYKKQYQMVVCYNDKKMLNKFYFMWRIYYRAKMHKKYLKERSDQQYYQRLLKRSLKQFVLYIREIRVDKRKMKMSNNFYESKILAKIFNAWVQWYHKFSKLCSIMIKVQQIVENKIKQKIILHWKSYIFHKKCTRRKIRQYLIKYEIKILANAFNKLRDYVLYKKRKQMDMSNLNIRTINIITTIQNIYIEKWNKILNVHMQEKHKTFLAVELFNNYISKRYLYLWKLFSQRYKLKLLQKKELNERASCFLLNKYIIIWKLKCENNYKMYKKEEYIDSIIRKKIQEKYFVFWKKYINQKINKKREIEYAKNINKKFILQEGLKEILKHSLFTMQLHHENRIKNTTLKLVEDFEILSKYFDKWLSIVNLKGIKYTNIKENIKYHSFENIEENNGSFNNDNASIIVPSSENYINDITLTYTDPVISFNCVKNNSDERDTLFINSTNNNLYSIPLYNDKSMSSLTNNVELLPPSAFY